MNRYRILYFNNKETKVTREWFTGTTTAARKHARKTVFLNLFKYSFYRIERILPADVDF